jgi:hypothetical protein
MDGKTAIAVAGIVATAAVGLAAAGLGWVTNRDDRATQRQLAHDARVYDRKADAYLAALAVIHKQDVQMQNASADIQSALSPTLIPLFPGAKKAARKSEISFAMANNADATERAGLIAFGSSPIVTIYKAMEHKASDLDASASLFTLAFNIYGGNSAFARKQGKTVSNDLDRVQKRWVGLQQRFENLVHAELS